MSQIALVVSFGVFFMVKNSDPGRIISNTPQEAKRVSINQCSIRIYSYCMFVWDT